MKVVVKKILFIVLSVVTFCTVAYARQMIDVMSNTTGSSFSASSTTSATPKPSGVVSSALRVGTGLLMVDQGAHVAKDSVMAEGDVGSSEVFTAGVGAAAAASGTAMALKIKNPVVVGVATAAAALLGAGAVATRIATQNDCFNVTLASGYKEKACCHTVEGNTALSGGVWYDIGQATFCPNKDGKAQFGYITYCGQKDVVGSKTYKTDQGFYKNDEWLECEESWCDDRYVMPANTDMNIKMEAFWKKNKAGVIVPCWRWECADPGYVRSGSECIPDPNAAKTATVEPKPEEEPKTEETVPAKKQTCNDLYKGHSKRLACCKAGTNTKWSDPKDLDGDHCYCVVPGTDKRDEKKTWDGTKCVEKPDESDDAAEKKDAETFKELCNGWNSKMSDTESSLSNDGKTCTVKSTKPVTRDDFVSNIQSALNNVNDIECGGQYWIEQQNAWVALCGGSTSGSLELKFALDKITCPEKQKFDAGTGKCVSDGNENDRPDDAQVSAAEEAPAAEKPKPDESKGCYGWADPTLCDNAQRIVDAHNDRVNVLKEQSKKK